MIEPSKGSLLIASPFLKDMHFIRSVVLICEHSSLGSLGIVLNKPFPVMLNDLVPDLDNITLPVYIGGPTQSDRIHFLHQYPDLIGGGEEIMKGVYWGGNYANLAVQLAKNTINPNRIKFFMGFSKWEELQLGREKKEKTWVTTLATKKLIFSTPPKNIWSEALKTLGGEYQQMIHYPLDPQLN